MHPYAGNPQFGARSIGAILIDNGYLDPRAADEILQFQRAEGLRFGDAALRLGYVTAAQLQQALSLQFKYPQLKAGETAVSPEVVAAFLPSAPVVEQLRVLRSQLLLRWLNPEAGGKALAVASPEGGDGRSFICANLAVILSQLGQSTLLVDADLRRPQQQRLFGLDGRCGLSSVLAELAEPEHAIAHIPGLKGLSVLPAGPPPPNPQELLGGAVFGRLCTALKRQFDVVIFDTPAAGMSADYQSVARHAGGVVLLCRQGVTSANNMLAVLGPLEGSGVTTVGAILNTY
jgi:receptor protein-tyrosine kinase